MHESTKLQPDPFATEAMSGAACSRQMQNTAVSAKRRLQPLSIITFNACERPSLRLLHVTALPFKQGGPQGLPFIDSSGNIMKDADVLDGLCPPQRVIACVALHDKQVREHPIVCAT